MSDHEGRRYAIVGGTSGMGFAAARCLAEEGARVVLIGRDRDRAAAVARTLGPLAAGDGVAEGGAGAAVDRAARTMGGLDGLAVTAGPINSHGTVADLTDDQWAESFDTQLMTVVRSLRAAIPLLQANGGGSIVTTAAYSMRAQKNWLPHYTAMKSAIASVTKNVAKSFGADGIRANCIAPGAVASEALDCTKAEAAELYGLPPGEALNRYMKERWGMNVALGRVGEPPEVGELIAFLLSGRAAYMTGALINIDGGTDF
ncbi:SDR family oxidoreductase [Sphingobium sp. Sx8-8]|uniref:SDR family NAD(P)-dependent oxidoreductase n=1 Tax=Sphingobium sp. Sx8-8 TaxID=2933617 RepID=UPI001F55F133|nr:SDR family oxidoreductase [Sphingobium sp. Sx8-8]